MEDVPSSSAACPANLPALVPPQWASGTEFTSAAAGVGCAVPACNNFTVVPSLCCISLGGPSSVRYFNTSVGMYAECTLLEDDGGTDADEIDGRRGEDGAREAEQVTKFLRLQMCMQRDGLWPMKCNDEVALVRPAGTESSEVVCGGQANFDVTRALPRCCSRGNEYDALVPFDNGCRVYRVSDDEEDRYRECLRNNIGGEEEIKFLDSPGENDEEEPDGGTEGRTWANSRAAELATALVLLTGMVFAFG